VTSAPPVSVMTTNQVVRVTATTEAPKVDEFQVTGVREPVRVANWADAVRIRFPGLPYSMVFKPPSVAAYRTREGLMCANGYSETMIGGESYEWVQDQEIRHIRIWAEEATPARAVVRFRGALVNHRYVIAHTEAPSGSPYGEGDWAEEVFYVYPDGVHVRVVRIYTGVAARADSGFLRQRLPGRIPFENQETHIMGPGGHQPPDDIAAGAVTLIRMTGETYTVPWRPYPRFVDLFPGANIQVVNLKYEFKPYVIVPANAGFEFIPYYGSNRDLQFVEKTTVVAWPSVPVFKNGYTAALTHIVNPNFYERAKNTLTQVYLCGMTGAQSDPDKAKHLVPVAQSWLNPPPLVLSGQGYRCSGYEKLERAYHLERAAGAPAEPLRFALNASAQSPLLNPALVIDGWGQAGARVLMNNHELKGGDDFRCGHEKQPPAGRLVIWLKTASTIPVQLVLEPVE
jgi:hypothetical protein